MIRRLVVLCCILLLPTIAAAQGNVNPGDFWIGGQVMGVFTPDTDVTFSLPNLAPGQEFSRSIGTDPAIGAGAIVGYNFCMPYRQVWERYFGVALDFQWNQFNHPGKDFNFTTRFGRQVAGSIPKINGNQFALSLLGRLQYPLMGSEMFTRGRIVPFLMFGPAVVWTDSSIDSVNFGSVSKTSSDFALVAEVGVEFFIIPQLSIGPSFRYRHIFTEGFEGQFVQIDSDLNQFMVLGRLAYHF
jgi:opacity protein-like surface antigen